MARPPVHQPARVRQYRRIGRRQQAGDIAQILERAERLGQERQRVVDLAHVHGKHRRVVQQAEERPGAAGHAERSGRLAAEVDGLRPPVRHAAHQVARAPDGHEQGLRILERRLDPGVVVAQVRGAVERAAGIGVRAAGKDEGHALGTGSEVGATVPRGAGARQPRAPALPGVGRDVIWCRGRSAADERLANPVRSGRKQPQRVPLGSFVRPPAVPRDKEGAAAAAASPARMSGLFQQDSPPEPSEDAGPGLFEGCAVRFHG